MKFKGMDFNGKKFVGDKNIIKVLQENKFYWLIDSEIENADIQIINNTIIWISGDYYAGNWHYGIWKSGNFYGIWENGIFESGNFNGKFISGIKTET